MIGDIHRFWVPGPPVGKGAVTHFATENGVRGYNPKKTASYMRTVAEAAMWQIPGVLLLDGPVGLTLTAVCPRPQSLLSKTWRLVTDMFCPKKPDSTNILKGVEDAIKSNLPNDSRVARTEVWKLYADPGMQCGVLVELEELPDRAPPAVLERVRQFLGKRHAPHS